MYLIILTLLGTVDVDYMELGFQCANDGDINGAIEAFREVTGTDPYNVEGWENQGVALLRKGIQTSERGLFRDSARSFKMAYEIVSDDPDLMENIKALLETMEQVFPRACHKEDSLYGTCLLLENLLGSTKSKLRAERESERLRTEAILSESKFQRLSEEERMEYLTNVDCSESRLRFKVTDSDQRRGSISRKTLSQLKHTFRDCGMIVIEKVYSDEFIEKLKMAESKHFEKWYMNKVMNTTKSEQRSKDRYEVWSPMAPPFTNDEFLLSPFLLPVIKFVMNSDRLEIDTFSSVTSLPGAPAQHWHRDAGLLFEYKEFPHPLPTYGIVMFVPLIDLVEENGPTEFWLKSHQTCRKMIDIEDGEGWTLPMCPWVKERKVVTGKRGLVILYDYYMMHRGGPNSSNEKRPLMYLSWVREWWIDSVNFNAQHTRGFDDLDGPKMRKILSRIDSKYYYEKLDDAILENNIDFARSKFHYHSYNYNVKSEL